MGFAPFTPHPDPLPRGEGTTVGSLVFSNVTAANPVVRFFTTRHLFLPLCVGGACGADGERAGVRRGFHHLWVHAGKANENETDAQFTCCRNRGATKFNMPEAELLSGRTAFRRLYAHGFQRVRPALP